MCRNISFVEMLQTCLYFLVFNQRACQFILVNFTGETTFEMAGHKSSSFELKIPVLCWFLKKKKVLAKVMYKPEPNQ